jgi:hypothetical protein
VRPALSRENLDSWQGSPRRWFTEALGSAGRAGGSGAHRLLPQNANGLRGCEAQPHFAAVDAKYGHFDRLVDDDPLPHFAP